MVIAPAKTGRERRRRKAVIKTDQQNNGSLSYCLCSTHKFKGVVMKLMAPKIDLIPAKCKEKITKSTLDSGWAGTLDKGG